MINKSLTLYSFQAIYNAKENDADNIRNGMEKYFSALMTVLIESSFFCESWIMKSELFYRKMTIFLNVIQGARNA